jgi:CYTH domain-containing protein
VKGKVHVACITIRGEKLATVRAEFFYVDGQADVMELIDTLCNITEARKEGCDVTDCSRQGTRFGSLGRIRWSSG